MRAVRLPLGGEGSRPPALHQFARRQSRHGHVPLLIERARESASVDNSFSLPAVTVFQPPPLASILVRDEPEESTAAVGNLALLQRRETRIAYRGAWSSLNANWGNSSQSCRGKWPGKAAGLHHRAGLSKRRSERTPRAPHRTIGERSCHRENNSRYYQVGGSARIVKNGDGLGVNPQLESGRASNPR